MMIINKNNTPLPAPINSPPPPSPSIDTHVRAYPILNSMPAVCGEELGIVSKEFIFFLNGGDDNKFVTIVINYVELFRLQWMRRS